MSNTRVKRKLKGYRRPKVNYRSAMEEKYIDRREELRRAETEMLASAMALLAASRKGE